MGAAVSIITGFLLPFSRESISFKDVSDVLFYVLILFGFGALTSVYSQLGFFAYMILNYTCYRRIPKKGLAIHTACFSNIGAAGSDVLPFLRRQGKQPNGGFAPGIGDFGRGCCRCLF
ncbi:KinB-signaling pathway activation protein [Paenibacillus sp. JTLBN-2024]